VPAGHGEQLVLFWDEKKPAGHAVQELLLVAPGVVEKVPAGQAEQVELLTPEKEPAGQIVHCVLPDDEKYPAGHVEQLDEPAFDANWPAGQRVQDAMLVPPGVVEKVPARQAVQRVLFWEEKKPAGHCWQELLLVAPGVAE
jgi:hypothetical protein